MSLIKRVITDPDHVEIQLENGRVFRLAFNPDATYISLSGIGDRLFRSEAVAANILSLYVEPRT